MQLFIPRCPKCLGTLERNGDTLTCVGCGEIYSVKHNIILFLDSLPLKEKVISRKTFFDNLAETYDNSIVSIVESMGCKWRSYTETLEDIIRTMDNKIILDIGCGTSFPLASFLPDSTEYLGLDLSSAMLTAASDFVSKDVSATFLNIEAEKLPLSEKSVDVCLSLFSLNSIPEPEKVVEKIMQVVRDGGEFIASFPVSPSGIHDNDINSPIREEVLEGLFYPLVKDRWKVSYFQCGSIRIYRFLKG